MSKRCLKLISAHFEQPLPINWFPFFILFALITQSGFSQDAPKQDTLIRLNRHYFEIAAGDTINHAFNKLVSPLGNSAELERIFTLDQRVHRIILTRHTKYEDLDRVTEQFDEYGQLEWRKSENLLIPKFWVQYFFNDEVIAHVFSDSRHLFHVARNGENEPSQQRFNDFEPRINGLKKDWYEFVSKNLRLSTKLYPEKPEEYWIAVLVNEHGRVDEIEWANPLGGNPKTAARYLHVVKLWGNNFSPALDAFGHPVSKWLLIPFWVEEGVRYPIQFFDPDSYLDLRPF
jgi:hypothetical protein